MKKITFLIILIVIILNISCVQTTKISKEKPLKFDVYYYNEGIEINIIDTKNNVYIKERACVPYVWYTEDGIPVEGEVCNKTFQLKLTESDKTQIFNSIIENDLVNIRDDFPSSQCSQGVCLEMAPATKSTLKINTQEKTKTIIWDSASSSIYANNDDFKKLQNAEKILKKIVLEKESIAKYKTKDTTILNTAKGESSDNFYVYYSFGVGEQNLLDTKNNKYIKDMICEPAKEYNLILSESEKNLIYNSIIENDLLNIKDDFTKNCNLLGVCKEVTPLDTKTIKIIIDNKTKTIKYSSNYFDENDSDLKKYYNVVNIINEIIAKKELEMNIEQPKCGYM